MSQTMGWLLGAIMVGGVLLVLYNAKPNMPPAFYGWFIGIGLAFLLFLAFFLSKSRS